MAASGPATLNFGTGLANALVDCRPVVAISGGRSPIWLHATIVPLHREVLVDPDALPTLRPDNEQPVKSSVQRY
jgi:hypothetical protein